MRISKTTHNAIRILITAARSGDSLVKVAEIARQLDFPEQNTFKIVHLLSRGGFVRAVRGRYGGVCLAQPASAIRIGDVVLAMERMSVGDKAPRPAKSKGQGFTGLFDSALEAFVDVLNQHTIADMVREPRLTDLGKLQVTSPAKAKRGRAKAASPAGPPRTDRPSRAKSGGIAR